MEKAFHGFAKPRNEPLRKNQKTPSALGGMLGGMLARHGIGAQVLAARIVIKGNEILDTLLPAEQRADVKVISYRAGILTVGCRHASAKFVFGQQMVWLGKKIEEALPDVSIAEIKVELRPDVWLSEERFNV